MTTEAEVGVMCLQPRIAREDGRGKGGRILSRAFREDTALLTPSFGLVAFSTVTE